MKRAAIHALAKPELATKSAFTKALSRWTKALISSLSSLSSPSDLTATPVAPNSNIAPKELIGIAKFPQLLGGFQSGLTDAKAPPVLSDAQDQSEIEAPLQDATPPEFTALEASVYGNALPRPGIGLQGGPQGGLGLSQELGQELNQELGLPPVPQGGLVDEGPPAKAEATDPRPNLAATPIAQTSAATSLAAKIASPAQLLGSTSDPRALAEIGAKRTVAGSGDLAKPETQMQAQTVNPLLAAILASGEGEAAPDLQRGQSSASPAFPQPSQPQPQPQALTTGEAATQQTPLTQAQSAPALLSPQTTAPVPIADTSAALKLGPSLENTIEQLAETRTNAQANKPELTVRHQEFGAITMRLDANGTDLRATLSARDPGFVPAIQSALAERSIAAGGETSSSNASKGNEQGSSNSNSQSNSGSGTFAGSHGQGWNSQGAYGSSTGSGQGTSQPYMGQTEGRDEELGSDQAARAMGQGDGPAGEGELFA